MKRFRFGPEKVRVWRDKQAEVEELKLQQLQAERQGLISRKEAMESQARTEEEAIRLNPRICAEDLANLDSYKQFVRARSSQLEAKKKNNENRIAQQQKVALAARRSAELLDRLKARRLAEWQTGCDREEENLSNELFLAKRNRAK